MTDYLLSPPLADRSALAEPAVDIAGLDRRLLSGIAWTGGVKWASQGFAWIATLFVARQLSPADYGLVGMAAVYLGLVTMITEFGIGAAVVTLRDLSDRQMRQLNALSVLLGLGGVAASFVASVPLARFFRTPELAWVVVAMSAIFIINSFRSLPSALLQRQLRFRLVALLDGLQSLTTSCLMVVLAVQGLRHWTLVIGAIAGAAISTGLTLCFSRYAFAFPRLSELRHAVSFSSHIVVSRIAWYAYSNADFVIAGRFLGRAALGSYSFAWELASMPVGKITTMLMGVTPGVFSAVQNQRHALRRYFLSLTEALSILTFPTAFGLGLVADIFVPTILGDAWTGAVTPLRILAFYAAFRSITPLLPQILAVVGETKFMMSNSIIAACVLPVGFVVGSRWGVSGIAVAWVLLHPAIQIPIYMKTFRAIDLTAADYLSVLRAPVLATLSMTAGILLLRPVLGPLPPTLRLVTLVVAGALLYGGAFQYIHPQGITRIRHVLATNS